MRTCDSSDRSICQLDSRQGKNEADALMSKDFDSATLIAAWVRNWCLDEDLHLIRLEEDFRYCCLDRGLADADASKRTYICRCLEGGVQMLCLEWGLTWLEITDADARKDYISEPIKWPCLVVGPVSTVGSTTDNKDFLSQGVTLRGF